MNFEKAYKDKSFLKDFLLSLKVVDNFFVLRDLK